MYVDEFKKVGFRTGLWLSELTHFWDELEKANYEMDIASPKGGKIPIDPESLLMTEVGEAVGLKGAIFERYEDRAFMDRLSCTLKLPEIDERLYAGIYMTGGHGVMFDFPQSRELAEMTARFYESGRIVSAVCHGSCGLLEARLTDGQNIVSGKNVTGFSWNEEVLAKRDTAVDYSLEDELRKRGGNYSKALMPFLSHVVEDGNLITGQNPRSAAGVGQAVVKQLQLGGLLRQSTTGS